MVCKNFQGQHCIDESFEMLAESFLNMEIDIVFLNLYSMVCLSSVLPSHFPHIFRQKTKAMETWKCTVCNRNRQSPTL